MRTWVAKVENELEVWLWGVASRFRELSVLRRQGRSDLNALTERINQSRPFLILLQNQFNTRD